MASLAGVRFQTGVQFLFPVVSRPALKTSKPPIHCLQVAISSGIKRQLREADYHLRLAVRSIMMELYYTMAWCLIRQSQSHFTADSQHVLVSSPLYGRMTRYCFLFKNLGLEFVVLSLLGALSDERPGTSFVSYSPVTCLFVHLL
jgi:hypothetical protein